MALLRADALGALEPHHQVTDRRGNAGLMGGRPARSNRLPVGALLALDLAHHHAQDRTLALDDFLQTSELLGVRVAAGLAPQLLALLGKVCLSAMPARLAALTTLCRAISSKRLSTG